MSTSNNTLRPTGSYELRTINEQNGVQVSAQHEPNPPEAGDTQHATSRNIIPFVSYFLYYVFLIPYSVFGIALRVLSLGEYLIRFSASPRPSRFGDLALVRAEKEFRKGVWKVFSFSIGGPAPHLKASIERILLPARGIQTSANHLEYMEEKKRITDEIQGEIDGCKHLLNTIREHRLSYLKESVNTSPHDHKRIDQYYEFIRKSDCLRRHLEDLRRDLGDIKFIANTQAVADACGYHGLPDWAKKSLENHQDFVEALYQVSFVGAGLTYSTIFSATRGSIGLMCYAFALFNCGFIVPLVILALLKWAATRPRETLFASPHIWSATLNGFIYFSVVAVVSAICVLNVTIILLRLPPGNGGASPNSNLEVNVAPEPAGYFAVVCAAASVVVTMSALSLNYFTNGWGTLFEALLSRRNDSTPEHRFHDYPLH